MSGERVERRLAAILAVDVAGYSRLMGEDEEGTLAALRAVRRELGDPKITEHRGRIVKTTGDGLLVEFASVVDAVRCAVEVQREMVARNAAVPAEHRIEFRMGVNVGDIIIEDGDIFGDGVNIAARREALAEPGGICISAAAHEQVRDKLDFSFEGRGAVKTADRQRQKSTLNRPGYGVPNVRSYPLGRAGRLAANTDAAGILGPIKQRRLAARGTLAQRDRTGQHEPRYVAERCERLMPDRVPPDVLELFACHRLAVHIIAVAEKEPGVESSEGM
jgi:class 3 adenylate cyclase